MASLASFAQTLETLRKVHGGEYRSNYFIHLKKDLSKGVRDDSLMLHRSNEFDYVIPFSGRYVSHYSNLFWDCLGFYDKNYEPTKLLFKPQFFSEELEATNVYLSTLTFKSLSIGTIDISITKFDDLSEEIQKAIEWRVSNLTK
jgi:hypothetical protein